MPPLMCTECSYELDYTSTVCGVKRVHSECVHSTLVRPTPSTQYLYSDLSSVCTVPFLLLKAVRKVNLDAVSRATRETERSNAEVKP